MSLLKYDKFKITPAAIEEAQEQIYILEGTIAMNRLTTVYADPNQGKTTLSMALARLINAIYLDAENPIDTFPDQILKKCDIYATSMGASMDDLKDILNEILTSGVSGKLIIVDTLSHFVDPNNNVDVQSFYQLLRRITNNGNGVVVLHHTNKGDSNSENPKKQFFGSSVIKAQSDTLLYLTGFSDDVGNIVVTMEPEKKRGYIEKRSYKISTLTYDIEPEKYDDPAQLAKDKPIINMIKGYLTEPRMTTQIHKYMESQKISRRRTNDILNRYINTFWEKGGDGRKRNWTLKKDENLKEAS
ncbi:AAA family ATPase [Hydrogenimonas cancrithermarum]|uniref:AAA+ ATPase domain-containing protein n=1 Tax=Hydrogenimonas cancrithermarum TaxID=2993563 RepID=A0ABN6WW28_9BACT|nr:AAA family ATPase [Hydrogenimonas cancrithermarum]BDY12397.1 hypothetical protein HCR_07090 [Hydrogenimonas cancrithermarum]